jgi:hypothetical protein
VTVTALRKHQVRAAGLPMIRLHDLRHSYATATLAAVTFARLILEGDEPEPTDSIDKPLTTGRIGPSTIDPAKEGEARSARSDGQRRRADTRTNHGIPSSSLWVTPRAWGRTT